MRVGLIARMDKSGLGQGQTRRIARLLNPDYLMVIDSTSFNGAKQYPEWYKDSAPHIHVIDGFPSTEHIRRFMEYVDVVISAETFYNREFTMIAKQSRVKTILIANPEFFDWLKPDWSNVTLPDKVIVPSMWMMDKMERFNAEYLPTPIFEDEFEKAREINLNRSINKIGKPRYLFLNGKTAAHDRAGLDSLYEAMQLAKGDFEVVVKAQGEVKKHPDPRLTYDFSNPDEQWKLYAGFDAMIHPRRYGGQSLPMTEALQSGLPVIMTDIDPNNKVLPEDWQVASDKTGEFMARIMIDIYSANPTHLMHLILWGFSEKDKFRAIELSKQYDAETLRPEYERVILSLL